MSKMGVTLNEDAMEEALKLVRARPKPAERQSTTGKAWLGLERRRRDLEAQLKTVVTEQEKVRLALLDEWSTAGITREAVDGYTIHTVRKVYPKVRDPHGLAAALLKEGLSDLLTVDEKTLAAWVTTHEEEGKPLPESVAPFLGESYERFGIAVRIPGRAH